MSKADLIASGARLKLVASDGGRHEFSTRCLEEIRNLGLCRADASYVAENGTPISARKAADEWCDEILTVSGATLDGVSVNVELLLQDDHLIVLSVSPRS